MKITAILLKLGQTRGIISPMCPKITEKREKRERERERETKRLATVFSFYSVDFGEKPVPKVTHRHIYICNTTLRHGTRLSKVLLRDLNPKAKSAYHLSEVPGCLTHRRKGILTDPVLE